MGRGTEIHHVQTNVGLDDGIEFFGGTVDLKYALITNASDDSFDYSTGWQGRGQFWIAQQNPDDADNGFEVDGNEDDYNAEPFTDPLIYNVTLVGNGPGGDGGEKSDIGLLLRRGAGGRIHNTVVIGFGDQALDVDNSETLSHGLQLRNMVFADNEAAFAPRRAPWRFLPAGSSRAGCRARVRRPALSGLIPKPGRTWKRHRRGLSCQ